MLSRRFFALPERDKRAIEMVNSPHFRGYNRAGLEHTRGKPDWREQIDVGAEREALAVHPAAPAWRRLQGPNQWPDALPELKPALLRYQAEVTALAIRVLRAFAAALNQPENVFEPIYTPTPNQLSKSSATPAAPPTRATKASAPTRTRASSPSCCRTRSPACRSKATTAGSTRRRWPGTFVVNIGEILELASSGYLRANVHRVVSPPAGGDRLSVAFFLGAQSRSDRACPRIAARTRGPGARPDAGPAQSALPRSRPQLPEEPAALASRRRAAAPRRSARPNAETARTGLGLLSPPRRRPS